MENPYVLTHTTPTKKDFIDTTDFDQAELTDILKVARATRDYLKTGKTLDTLEHWSLAMLLPWQSFRTRMAFAAGINQLGGQTLDFANEASLLGRSETITDISKSLGCMCDLMVARVEQHENLMALATETRIPVINGGSNYNHPTQELADILTILDHLPEGKPWGRVKVVFVGDCTQVCASLMMIVTKFGMNFIQYAPPAKWLADDYLKIGRTNTQSYGGSVHVTDNPAYLEGADFIYTDTWSGHLGQAIPKDVYLREFYPKYQVNDELLSLTGNGNVKFMHALPAARNEEVMDSIIDGASSIVWDQVENRLAVARGLMLYFAKVTEKALDACREGRIK